ncbi:uncharacterized mitochondrial protein AtMg00820-like [Humulus lupulus]|uniref:uncharacterized mitochondrial protein AtMg00820-like n=1 Tax=Humulus lupulus TaxID=3486 RepID=UPI002B41815A|nr:uncharacterized mitochondrial protein AtMg00820-like [Humulus lupulus]
MVEYQLVRDRVRRVPKPNPKYSFNIWNEDTTYTLLSILEGQKIEPETYEEAIKCKDAKKWSKAMDEEMDSLKKSKTWIYVPRPKGKSIVQCKWLFKQKEGRSKDEPVRYKARLVAKGLTQKEGVDYT